MHKKNVGNEVFCLPPVSVLDFNLVKNCNPNNVDLFFLVDGSGSIGSNNFQSVKTFLKDIVGQLEIGANKAQVGMIVFANDAKKIFWLDEIRDKGQMQNTIQKTPYQGGHASLAKVIRSLLVVIGADWADFALTSVKVLI